MKAAILTRNWGSGDARQTVYVGPDSHEQAMNAYAKGRGINERVLKRDETGAWNVYPTMPYLEWSYLDSIVDGTAE